MAIEKGNKIKISYEGTFEDGTVFDSSVKEGNDTPLEFEVGANQVIPALDSAVVGMEKGEEKEFKVQPSEAYGDYNKDLIKEIPKSSLPEGNEPKKGMMLVLNTPEGQQIPALITEIGEDSIKIDLNHPLAGKVLNFKIKIIESN